MKKFLLYISLLAVSITLVNASSQNQSKERKTGIFSQEINKTPVNLFERFGVTRLADAIKSKAGYTIGKELGNALIGGAEFVTGPAGSVAIRPAFDFLSTWAGNRYEHYLSSRCDNELASIPYWDIKTNKELLGKLKTCLNNQFISQEFKILFSNTNCNKSIEKRDPDHHQLCLAASKKVQNVDEFIKSLKQFNNDAIKNSEKVNLLPSIINTIQAFVTSEDDLSNDAIAILSQRLTLKEWDSIGEIVEKETAKIMFNNFNPQSKYFLLLTKLVNASKELVLVPLVSAIKNFITLRAINQNTPENIIDLAKQVYQIFENEDALNTPINRERVKKISDLFKKNEWKLIKEGIRNIRKKREGDEYANGEQLALLQLFVNDASEM